MYRVFQLFLCILVAVSLYGQTNYDDEIHISPCLGKGIPSQDKDDWRISLRNYSVYYHNDGVSPEEYKQLKDKANLRERTEVFPELRKIDTTATPRLGHNFRGNIRGNSIPMDNSMAVSRNGFVVSAINSNLIFALPEGTITYARNLSDFFRVLNLGTSMFDPRIAYDPEYNRFAVVTLHGSEPNNSYICIAFSRTEDPNGEWYYYKIKGDHQRDNVWFDFPNIAFSKSELFIAGNMFTSEGQYRYSSIIQMDKISAYQGQEMKYKFYAGVNSTSDGNIFNPVPVMSGTEILTNEMHFISGGYGFNVNVISNTLTNDPVMTDFRVSGPIISYPPNAKQRNSKVLLDTGGNRIRSAIMVDGVIHFVAQTGTTIGTSGIYYGRLNTKTKEMDADVFSEKDIDLAYPTITTFGSVDNNDVFLINYVYAGDNALPGMAVRAVSGAGNEFNWSEAVITKHGVSPIGNDLEYPVRWGDYTGACSRFFNKKVESWVCGTFGMNNAHNTWIGQYLSPNEKSRMEFIAIPSTTEVDSMITLTDVSDNNPMAREWILPNGSTTNTIDSVITLKYADLGGYDVTLVHHFESHSDTLYKDDYIHIIQPETKPIADWTLDNDTIFVGDSVRYTSLSSLNSFSHKWTFLSGSPSNSTERNPVITYHKKGTFLASLTVFNIAGTNTLTKPKAITVLEKTLPKSDFSANFIDILEGDTVQFENFSTNAYDFQWHFEGGTPEVSQEVTPIVQYNSKGVYDVMLITSNAFGADTLIRENYINVGVSATEDNQLITNVKVSPNPIRKDDIVTITFENNSTQHCDISIFDASGRLVKVLYDNKVKSGINALSFNSAMLQQGTYFIVFGASASYQLAKMIQIFE